MIIDTSEEAVTNKEQGYTDLQLIRGYDPEEFPYCIARGVYGLVLLDLKRNKTFSLLRLRPM